MTTALDSQAAELTRTTENNQRIQMQMAKDQSDTSLRTTQTDAARKRDEASMKMVSDITFPR